MVTYKTLSISSPVARFISGLVIASIFACQLITPATARAEDEGFVCAAVMPCNPDGTVMQQFDQGQCAPMYRSQCLSRLTNDVQEALVICKEKLKATQESLAGTRRQLRDMRKKAAARR